MLKILPLLPLCLGILPSPADKVALEEGSGVWLVSNICQGYRQFVQRAIDEGIHVNEVGPLVLKWPELDKRLHGD